MYDAGRLNRAELGSSMRPISLNDFPKEGGRFLDDEQFGNVHRFLTETLTESHPRRNGAVCPMAHSLVRNNRVFLYFFDPGIFRDGARMARPMLRAFEYTGSTIEAPTVLMCFPPNPDISFAEMNRVRTDVSYHLIKRRKVLVSMIHPEARMESMYKVPGFYPLKVDVPAIIVRDIVPGDLPMLSRLDSTKASMIAMLELLIEVIGLHPDTARNQRYLEEAKLCMARVQTGRNPAVDPHIFFK